MMRVTSEQARDQMQAGAMPKGDGSSQNTDPLRVHSPEVEGTDELRATDQFAGSRLVGVVIGLVYSVGNTSLLDTVVGSEFTVAQFMVLLVVFATWMAFGRLLRSLVYYIDDGGYGLRKVWTMVLDALTVMFLTLLSRYAFTLLIGEQANFVLDYGMIVSFGFVFIIVSMVFVFYANNILRFAASLV